MHVYRDLAQPQLTEPTVLTIGTFDGLHLGHQHLLNQLKTAAQTHQARSAVISFHPRPKAIFATHKYGQDYLTTAEERIVLFKQHKIDILILMPFSLELAKISANDFMQLLVDRLNIVEFWAGHDFALGKNREGTTEKLSDIGKKLGYSVRQFEPFLVEGETVSSTQVRRHITTGDIAGATKLLGRYPSLTSHIIKGDQRGRTIGFPTANFAVPAERLLPTNGVYATFVTRHKTGQRHSSVTNIGIRPSFEGQHRTIEAFIFDFNEDIYGETLTLEFVEHLRPEQKFDGIEALISQINQDAEQARQLLLQMIE